MAVHPKAAWLDAMGIDRWVERGSVEAVPAADTASTVQWLSRPTAAILTVVSCAPLDDEATAVLGKMLSAIKVSREHCALALVDAPVAVSGLGTLAVLVLAMDADETLWAAAVSDASKAVEVVAHPARFADAPGLKRPAWEALKRLEQRLHVR